MTFTIGNGMGQCTFSANCGPRRPGVAELEAVAPVFHMAALLHPVDPSLPDERAALVGRLAAACR